MGISAHRDRPFRHRDRSFRERDRRFRRNVTGGVEPEISEHDGPIGVA